MRGILGLCLIMLFTFSNAYGRMLVRKNYDIDHEWDLRSQKSWLSLGRTSDKAFSTLFQILERSSTARKIVAKAEARANKQGHSLRSLLYPGDTSLCDMTLVRRFSPSDPTVISYETQSKVYLNRDLKVFDGVLDLIHELTHFSYRESFNPYQLNFTLPQFIASTIEGRGGEVDAYMVECQVLSELAPEMEKNHSVCQKIRDPKTLELSRFHASKEFYKAGDDYSEFWKKVKKHKIEKGEIAALTDDSPTFISSATNTSYPLAAVLEYEHIVKRACDNDLKRMAIFTSKIGRFPASENNKLKNALGNLEKSYQNRCQLF